MQRISCTAIRHHDRFGNDLGARVAEGLNALLADLSAELSTPWLALAIAGALLAGLARGFSGFGTGLIYMPLASAALGPRVAVAALFIFDLAIMGGPVIVAARKIDLRGLMPLALGSVCLIPVGGWIAANGDPLTIRWTLSLFVLSALGILIAGLRWREANSVPVSIAVGGLSGFMGGLASLNGIVLATYWLGRDLAPALFRSSMLSISCFTLPVTAATYLLNGMFTAHVARIALLLIVPYLIGTTTGARMFHLATQATFRCIAYGMICLSGIIGSPLLDHVFGR